MEKDWKEKIEEFSKHARGISIDELKWKVYGHILAKLPKWFGERPGRKAGEPDSPEDEEEGANAADEEPNDDEEVEEEVEEEVKIQMIQLTFTALS